MTEEYKRIWRLYDRMVLQGQHSASDVVEMLSAINSLLDSDLALRDAFLELFNMVNHALESRDALLISKTCPTMLKAAELLKPAE